MTSERGAEIRSFSIRSAGARAGLVAAAVAVILLSYFPLKWGFAATAATRAEDLDVARFLIEAAPNDPQTHAVYAVLLEKSFIPADVDEALREYERAAALAPDNYLYWMQLGRARERAGDERAEPALRRALSLAPNYAQVRWALGNFLVRQKRSSEGFSEIRTAVASDPKLAGPAANTAWLVLGGNVAAVREALGGSSEASLALVDILARENKFDEAMAVWESVPKGDAQTNQNAIRDFATKLGAAHRFRDAARVSGKDEAVGRVNNPGFESPLKLQNTDLFDWKLSPGPQGQIAPTNGQKHGGDNSLAVIFNSAAAGSFPQVSQTVAVEPGRTYELEAFYRSTIRTVAAIKMSVAEAGTDKVLAQTPIAAGRSEWIAWNARFVVPAGVDGVDIKLVVENCGSGCTISGTLWLDDVSLKPVN
jgi:tetratricopeptide (TPR) repeat protein